MFRSNEVGCFELFNAVLLIFFLSTSSSAFAGENDYLGMSLDDLMNVSTTTASKRAEKSTEAPAIMTVIPSSEIELYGALNLSDVLDRVTSVFFLGTYFSPNNMVAMRGDATSNYNVHVLILLDGRPVRDSLTGGWNSPIYMAFPVDMIDHLEIIRGPGSVLYGTNAYMGVINILTKKAESDLQAGAGMYVGSQHTAQGSAFALAKRGDLKVSIAAEHAGIKGFDFTATDEAHNTQTMRQLNDHSGIFAEAEYKGLSAEVFYGASNQNTMGVTPVWNTPAYPVQDDTTRIFADLGYEVKPAEMWTSNLNLTYNHNNIAFNSTALPAIILPTTVTSSNNYHSDDGLVEWTNQFQACSNVNLIVGGLANLIGGDATKNSEAVVLVPHYQQLWEAAYLQADYTPVSWIRLVAGGQVNWVTNINANVVPRLGAVFSPVEHWTAKLLYGEAFRSATGIERGFQSAPTLVGNPSLLPEKVNTTEFQVSYTEKTYEISADVYSSLQDQRIDREAIAGVPTYSNLGQIYDYGAEAEGRANLKDFTLEFGASYARSKLENIVLEPTDMPTLMVKAGAGYTGVRGMRFGLFDSFYGAFNGLPNNPPNVNPQVSSYQYVTANAYFDLGTLATSKLKGLGIDVYATNLLNATIFYPEYVRQVINSIPGQGGTSIYGGLNYRL